MKDDDDDDLLPEDWADKQLAELEAEYEAGNVDEEEYQERKDRIEDEAARRQRVMDRTAMGRELREESDADDFDHDP